MMYSRGTSARAGGGKGRGEMGLCDMGDVNFERRASPVAIKYDARGEAIVMCLAGARIPTS